MEPCNERALLYLLAIEAFFMQQETLYKFLKATKSAADGKNYLSTLINTKFNPEQDTARISKAEDLGIQFPTELEKPEKERIEKGINNIIKTCKDLVEPNENLSPLYYVLKHGFLIYEVDGGLQPLMHSEKNKRFFEYLNNQTTGEQENALQKNDFSHLIDLTRRLAYAIQDIIAIRLIQLGVTTL
ncbi:MAG: hypothetical protein U9M98_03640 [Patescibacteria group bacterium]|nr:hypothetical protein [Patescibacteria group bacterium]